MLKAIIVDNEEPAINVLRILLERTGQVKCIESYLSANDAISELKLLKPDVAFLDIEMPETTGLDLAKKIHAIDNDVEIIFVTAYDQYALKAFRVNALDYILKPISYEDVEHTIARLVKRKGLLADVQDALLNSTRIYCFGKLSVYGPDCDQPIKWRTSKAEELFAYMLQNLGKEVPKWKICDALWPECDLEKVDIYLHTTIYKMKKALSSINIKFDFNFINGCYRMNLYQIYLDTAEFDSILDSILLLDSDSYLSEDTLEKYEKAFSIYKNAYLDGNDYIWTLSKKEEYSKKCSELAEAIVMHHMKNNDYTSSEKTLRGILDKSPLDEHFHEMLLKLYFIKRDRVSFITHYSMVSELFKNDLGIEPTNSMKALYLSISRKYKIEDHII